VGADGADRRAEVKRTRSRRTPLYARHRGRYLLAFFAPRAARLRHVRQAALEARFRPPRLGLLRGAGAQWDSPVHVIYKDMVLVQADVLKARSLRR